MTIEAFCRAVATIGQRYGGSVTSWGRTDAHARTVGGFAGDPHTWWLGADMVYDLVPYPMDIEAEVAALGLRVIHEPRHDHFQPLDFPVGPVTTYKGETRVLAD